MKCNYCGRTEICKGSYPEGCFLENDLLNASWTRERVQKCFDELGFEFPQNDEQLEAFNEKFKDYPHKLTGNEVDPIKIINSIKQ